jgi:hypothetical protein
MSSSTATTLRIHSQGLQKFLCCAILLVTSVTQRDLLKAQTVRLAPTRDTWLSNAGSEIDGANGKAPRLKFKSIQELSLIDFDFSSLRGKQVGKASLWLRASSDTPLDRMTISTMTLNWVEGPSTSYGKADGQSTFANQRHPNARWGDSDVLAAALGAGSSLWRSIQPVKHPDGWFEYPVPPELIYPCAAGLAHGWLVMDDTGSTWQRDGEKFQFQLFPNRFAYSLDSNRTNAPYLLVELQGPLASSSLPTPSELKWIPSTDSDPRIQLSWRGESNSLAGVQVFADGQPVGQQFLPSLDSAPAGQWLMPIHPMYPPWSLDQSHQIEVEFVGCNGETSSRAQILSVPTIVDDTIIPRLTKRSSLPSRSKLATTSGRADWSRCLSVGGNYVAIVNPLDKFSSDGKTLIPGLPEEYLTRNVLWNADDRSLSLKSARGQWIGFQLCIAGKDSTKSIQLAIQNSSIRSELYRYEYVPSKLGATEVSLADPLRPVLTNASLTSETDLTKSEGAQNFGAWLVDLYIPANERVGDHTGRLQIKSGGDAIAIDVKLEVHSTVLPTRLSFLPEMNCYDLPSNDRDYYRLGHRHRVVVNRVPYYQNGRLAEGLAPQRTEKGWDWSEWDRRFADLFTGQAFADLPRGPEPIECFYFPMHENWPTPMEGSYNQSYWADEAFPESYRNAWVQAVTDFSDHVASSGWKTTRFHVFLNNKVDFKNRGWSRGSSPWLLDEPANFQDFVALRYYGSAFLEGVAKAQKANVLYRCDISRPQWQRTTLDGMLGYNVISQSAFREYRRLVLERKWNDDQVVMIYGSNNPISINNAQTLAWAWDTWLRGADGILPWQTIGNDASWKSADELALFYPSTPSGRSPIPSIRLKAYCYAQQDIELLRKLWEQSTKQKSLDRYQWGERFRAPLELTSVSRTDNRYVEDAGWSDYGTITPESFELWRRELLSRLDETR